MPEPVKYHVGAFPPGEIEWAQLIPLIGPANAAVARYDGLLNAIPNAAVLLSPLMTQELDWPSGVSHSRPCHGLSLPAPDVQGVRLLQIACNDAAECAQNPEPID